jgi:hypothetical protein
MVRGGRTAAGALEVTIIARAASMRRARSAYTPLPAIVSGVPRFTNSGINVLICTLQPGRKGGIRLASNNFNHRRDSVHVD